MRDGRDRVKGGMSPATVRPEVSSSRVAICDLVEVAHIGGQQTERADRAHRAILEDRPQPRPGLTDQFDRQVFIGIAEKIPAGNCIAYYKVL